MQGDYEIGADYSIILRFYGDSRKEQMGNYNRSSSGGSTTDVSKRNAAVWKGEKPRIPSMDIYGKHKGKAIFQAAISDGSSTVLYPFICVST